MEIHVYPVINLPDVISSLYNIDGQLQDSIPDKKPIRSLWSLINPFRNRKKNKYIPKMPDTLEQLQREYIRPTRNIPDDEKRYYFDYRISQGNMLLGKGGYLQYLNHKLRKYKNVFEPYRIVCEDFTKSLMAHEFTGIIDKYVVGDVFIPEVTHGYASDADSHLPDSILESKLFGPEGNVMGSVINMMIDDRHRVPSEDVTIGVLPRPMTTYLSQRIDEKGKSHPINFSGERFGNNLVVSYGFVYNKSILRHTSLLPIPGLQDSVGYSFEIDYDKLILLLTEIGLHEWYHTLKLDHHIDGRDCVMNITYRDFKEGVRLDLCDECKITALMNATLKKEKYQE